MSNSWFGPWMPRWFGPWFPGFASVAAFQGYGPSGAATFAVDLESGFKVTWDWGTDVEKSYSGKEKRAAPRLMPKQQYDGSTVLLGTDPARIRGQLGALMGLGIPFLLGLQYEGMTLVADSAGSVVFVNAARMPYRDFIVEGQRVVLKDQNDPPSFFSAVIQSYDLIAGSITLDGSPGTVGKKFCEIIPAMAIFFEAQQSMDRYPTNVEEWHMTARNAITDFAPPRASLDLGALTGDVALTGAILKARKIGYSDYYVELNGHLGAPAGGSLTESAVSDVIGFSSGVTKLSDIATLLINQSDNFLLTGNYNPNAVLTNASDNAIANVVSNLVTMGQFGNGAVLASHSGKFVWDWPIQLDTSGQDTVQSMINLFDFGGVPVSVATSDVPDYGRHVMIRSGDHRIYQWLKKFLASVRGSQKAFWLPTWRPDLVWQSGVGTVIVVTGDVKSWYPTQHDRLMVVETGGVVVYTQILSAVDNHNGTTTLTLADAVANVQMISWLELSRFAKSKFSVVWNNHVFAMETTARGVQQ